MNAALEIPDFTSRAWMLRRWLKPQADHLARRVVWTRDLLPSSALDDLEASAFVAALKGKLTTKHSPHFRWEEVSAALLSAAIDFHMSVSDHLRKEVRRLAYDRAPGQEIIAAANRVCEEARIRLPDDVVLATCQEVARATVRRARVSR